MANHKKELIKKQEDLSYLIVKDNEELGGIMSPEDVVIPRIKICQTTSQIKDLIQDVKDGDFYDTVNQKCLGKKINFYITLFWRSKVWFTDDFKLLGSSFIDINTKQLTWIGDEEYCKSHEGEGILSFNYMIVLKYNLLKQKMPFPYIISFSSASVKFAKKLNARIMLNQMKKIPIYAQEIICDTILQKFKKGKAYMPNFNYANYISKDKFITLKAVHSNCKALFSTNKTIHETEIIDNESKGNNDEAFDEDKLPF